MKNNKNSIKFNITILYFILPVVFLTGCAGFTDVKIRKGIESGQIRLGATKSEVAKIVGAPLVFCVKKRIKSEGVYELWDYSTNLCGNNWTESYAFIFKDDRLVEIRTIGSRNDLQF